MKRIAFSLAIAVAALTSAPAQVSVEVAMDQDQFLPGEGILAKVKVTNHAGRVLHLGEDPDWLTFSMETRGVNVVPRTGDVPVQGEFFLGSSKVATKWVNLQPYFSFGGSGSYAVIATVRVKDLNRSFSSPPRRFDVIEGANLWEQDIGIPNSTNSVTEVRRYVLQQANYLKNQLQLYLRIVEPGSGKVFCVMPIGPMVSFGQPEQQVDKYNNLHVLYQDHAHSFSYTVFNPDGVTITNQVYEYNQSRPRLQPDSNGDVVVRGGALRDTSEEAGSSTNQAAKGAAPIFPGASTPYVSPPPKTNEPAH